MNKTKWSLLSTMAMMVALFSSCGGSSDMQTIRQRTIELYLNDLKSPAYESYKMIQLCEGEAVDSLRYLADRVRELDERVKKFSATIKEDGTWDDVIYNCQQRNSWRTGQHMQRISQMTKAYSIAQSAYYQNDTLLNKVFMAMDFWHEKELKSTNWWQNEIGGPGIMGNVYLVLQDKMSPKQMEGAIRFMDNATIKITGQNKVWLCSNVMVKAMLTKNLALFEEAIREMKSVIKVEDGEGVQYDWSFHQHGRQQQFGNYGLSYPTTLISRGKLFMGTKYAFNNEQVSILRNYLLEGMSWVVWRGEMDVNSINRQLFFKDAMKAKANTYGMLLLGMAELDPSNKARYEQMFDVQILGRENDVLTGIKHFNMSDQTAVRQKDWAASLKMCSDRTVGAEVVNLENMLCEVMANGGLYLYQDGGEYNNIFPIWDWTKVPGVTCNFTSHDDFPKHNRRVKGKTEVVGGLVKDNYGVSVMRVEANGLVANKSWYFTDQYILCLGSDISSNNGNVVTTAVNQVFKNGDPLVKIHGGQRFNTQVAGSGALEAVLHGQVGYYFPDNQNVIYTAGVQNGSWHKIHDDSRDTLVRGEVFKLYLSHGNNPRNSSYSYAILPRCNQSKLESFGVQKDFSIIKNREDVHAVRFGDGTVRSVFFTTKGSLEVDDLIHVLSVSEEGILVFKRDGNKVRITYVDPTTEKDSIIATFKGQWSGENATYLADQDVTVVEFDTKISWGKPLEATCERIN